MGSGNLPKHTIIENDLLSKIKNGVYHLHKEKSASYIKG